MNEKLNGRIGSLMDGVNLFKAQFARKDNLGESDISKKFRLLNAANITLGAGMQFNRGNIQFQNPHILYDQSINTGLIQIGN